MEFTHFTQFLTVSLYFMHIKYAKDTDFHFLKTDVTNKESLRVNRERKTNVIKIFRKKLSFSKIIDTTIYKFFLCFGNTSRYMVTCKFSLF